MFDGVCDETKKIQTLHQSVTSSGLPANLKWIRSSSGNHMFVRFDKGELPLTGFSANIHYGK